MTMPVRRNLLSQLRVVEESYERALPNPALEKRLRARLEAAERRTWSFDFGPWLRTYARPMLIAAAACSVLVLSMNEQPPIPAHSSGIAMPHASEPSVEIGETPTGERLEPAQPHRRETPKTPLTSGPETPAPILRPLHIDPNKVFPVQPDPETPPEHGSSDGSIHWPSRTLNVPRQNLRNGSDAYGFWSPAQAIPGDFRSPNVGSSGGFTTPGRPKTPAPDGPRVSQAACATPETWKERAELDCEENGLELAELTLLEPCDEGLFRHAKHECSEASPDGECTTDTIGKGDICQDPGKLKELAYQSCKAAGQEMVDFSYVTDDCGWMTRKAKFTCCPFVAEPPPPQPPSCQSGGVGDGVTCTDAGLFKQEAIAVCDSLGQTLIDIQVVGNCPDNQATQAKFTCCPN